VRGCCETEAAVEPPPLKRPVFGWSGARRLIAAGKWIAPGAAIALIPKCPMCIAAYVALGTGVGISIPAATHLRTALMAACIVSMTYLAARRLVVLYERRG
jgi:hypothetical protein